MLPFKEMLFVGIGGFFGANARYLLTAWFAIGMERWFGLTNMPYGTLIVNVTGSFVLAIFSAWFITRSNWSVDMRLLIGTGFFGAYTTFSTFSNETIVLLRSGEWLNGISYLLLTNGMCLLGVVFGLWLASRWW